MLSAVSVHRRPQQTRWANVIVNLLLPLYICFFRKARLVAHIMALQMEYFFAQTGLDDPETLDGNLAGINDKLLAFRVRAVESYMTVNRKQELRVLNAYRIRQAQRRNLSKKSALSTRRL